MNTDEKRAYSRGYAAGRRLVKRQRQAAAVRARRDAFWQRAYLAALPAAIAAQGWKVGEKPITSLNDRTHLARDFAEAALRAAITAGRI